MDRSGSRKRRDVPQQPLHPGLRVFAGDDLGLVRAADVPEGPRWEGIQLAARWGEPDKSKAVTVLAISSVQGAQTLLGVGRASGDVDILDAANGVQTASIAACSADASSARITGLAFLPTTDEQGGFGKLVSCSSSGIVRVHACMDPDGAVGSSGRQWEQLASFQTCSNAACMAVDASGRYIAVGGEGCHVQVWSLQTQKAVFKAKGGKPNTVGLVDLPHITSLAFLPASSASQPSASNIQGEGEEERLPLRVLAGTAKHKLWLYDLMIGKRPQMDIAWNETRITALAPEPSGKRVWVANGLGVMEALDVAAKKVSGGGLKGAGGSIKALQLHMDLPIIAAAGLDRFLRLYDAHTRKCLCKLYLKQQLTAVAFGPVPPPAEAVDADDAQQPAMEPTNWVDTDIKEHEETREEQQRAPKKHKSADRLERQGKHKSKSKGRSKGN